MLLGMGGDKNLPVGPAFLGLLSVALLVVTCTGYFTDQSEGVTIALLIAGVLLGAGAAFFNRVEGVIELGKEGFKLPVVAARRAEKQIEEGRVLDRNAVDALLQRLDAAATEIVRDAPLALPPTQQGGTNPQLTTLDDSRSQPTGRRSVLLVENAVERMTTLSTTERDQIRNEVARMSGPDFDETSDHRGHRKGGGGIAYRVRQVPDSDLRLWYRPLKQDEADGPLAIVAIEKKGEDY